jgi:hypothetical protein
MRISELIKKLQQIQRLSGDLRLASIVQDDDTGEHYLSPFGAEGTHDEIRVLPVSANYAAIATNAEHHAYSEEYWRAQRRKHQEDHHDAHDNDAGILYIEASED